MGTSDEGPRVQPTSAALASSLRELAARLEEQAYRVVPDDEPALTSGPRLRRAVKRREFRLLRPILRRSDRTAGRIASLTAELADRMIELEDVVRRLDASRAWAERATRAATAPSPDDRPTVSDSFYWRFEAAMRGSNELIDARLRQYERFAGPWREQAGAGRHLWIDIGAGRGEFGAILREWGWDVLGVETSVEAFEACREAGIDAVVADGLSFLDAYGGRAPGVVSGIQVIEHLRPSDWQPFFHAAHRVLAPGGRLLLETINPLNVAALAEHFFADVTHTWPLHPEVARLMSEDAGFAEAEIVFLNHDHRGNAQDFAVIATKGTDPDDLPETPA